MYRISKRVVVRALAVLIWVCLVLAPSPSVGQDRFLTSDEVYELWDYFVSEYDPEWASRCDSASDYFHTSGGYGFQFTATSIGRTTLRGTIVSTNGLSWIAGYPLVFLDIYGNPSDYHLIPRPVEVELTNDVSALLSSVWASIYNIPGQTLQYTNAPLEGWWSSSFRAQPHGRVLGSAVRLTWSNCPVGVFCYSVRYAPYWWASTTDSLVDLQTYEQITGISVDDLNRPIIVLQRRHETDSVFTNVNVRLGEVWR